MTAPLCFASADLFALWLSSDLHMPRQQRCDGIPCTDCTPSYQLRMKKQGRCAHPETVFSIDSDGGIFGRWP